jgi:hypothetical protein
MMILPLLLVTAALAVACLSSLTTADVAIGDEQYARVPVPRRHPTRRLDDNSVQGTCDFEEDTCSYYRAYYTPSTYAWTRNSGSTPSYGGPIGDHGGGGDYISGGGGYYMVK